MIVQLAMRSTVVGMYVYSSNLQPQSKQQGNVKKLSIALISPKRILPLFWKLSRYWQGLKMPIMWSGMWHFWFRYATSLTCMLSCDFDCSIEFAAGLSE